MEVYAETFDIAAMARDVATTVGSLVDKKEQRARPGPAGPTSAPMYSDVVKIRQILINLLSNSAKFTERGHDHPRRPARARRGGRARSCSSSPTRGSA